MVNKESYEENINSKIEKGEELPKKLDISMIKYFWQAGPLSRAGNDSIPRFLRKINVLKNFSDHELHTLSTYLHRRSFGAGERVFKQNDVGVGFYIIFSGHVDVMVEPQGLEVADATNHILSLEKHDYFGEMALLQENSVRNATVVARDQSVLLGIFKPDLEDLIQDHPVVATKLLQSVSMIIANRLFSLTKEVSRLKYRIEQLESSNANQQD